MSDPLDINAPVPCALCGGASVWTDVPAVNNRPAASGAECAGRGAEWYVDGAPVTWRTLATCGGEVEPVYVARLVEEVERLTAENATLRDAIAIVEEERNVAQALTEESRSREEYQRIVNALLCRPTEVAPLSNQDHDDYRVAVRSSLMTMAFKLMAAAVRTNPNAVNYGAWKACANPEALDVADPGSPEDIDGWDIHVACVRPGGKGPADLCAERTQERDEAIRERDALRAQVEALADRVTAAEGRQELRAMAQTPVAPKRDDG